MTARGTALLLIVLTALLAWLGLAGLGVRREAAPTPAAPLLPMPAAEVARVELREPGRRLLALRADGSWRDEHGHGWRADVVAGLVDTLATLAPLRIVDANPGDPAEFGLGPDAARLEVGGADGPPALVLELGARNPPATAMYARVAGRREVMLVGALLDWEIDKLRAAAPTH